MLTMVLIQKKSGRYRVRFVVSPHEGRVIRAKDLQEFLSSQKVLGAGDHIIDKKKLTGIPPELAFTLARKVAFRKAIQGIARAAVLIALKNPPREFRTREI